MRRSLELLFAPASLVFELEVVAPQDGMDHRCACTNNDYTGLDQLVEEPGPGVFDELTLETKRIDERSRASA
ncbi:hypothetical protein B0H17DRAFT_1111993 [Mycena rosella]|uniref:Uncharacterized protein n=1 Tax=Mycena rosella TaxID=1033263 RepID=A0AAD7FJR5_MYCRO|nr:hypothetical protein B0H17DRAFT_1111993 [Mycena rosella]